MLTETDFTIAFGGKPNPNLTDQPKDIKVLHLLYNYHLMTYLQLLVAHQTWHVLIHIFATIQHTTEAPCCQDWSKDSRA